MNYSRDEYTPELRHLRDAICVLKREFSFYQDEFVAEAKKSVDNINVSRFCFTFYKHLC